VVVKNDLVEVQEQLLEKISNLFQDTQEKLSHFEKVVVDNGTEIIGFRIQIKNI